MSVSSPASPTTIFSRNVPYTSALFPLLQEVTLRKVHSCPSTLHAFLTSIPRARRIDFHGTPIDSIKALYPQLTADAGIATVSCACPQLQTLDLHISHADFDKSLTEVGNLARQRFRSGGLRLQNVSIHLDNTNGCTTEKVIFMPDVGTTVTVVSQEEEDEFIDYDMDSDQDPFEVGGAFNDPVFDAQYAAMFNH
ncbi:hypothetical protein H0H92_013483 [Tricholoma furcatifolium]|nr:hypothetical protein H0H92_013483 [Tricholoma furcatifolium]